MQREIWEQRVSCGYVHVYPLPEGVVETLVPLEAGLLVESLQGCLEVGGMEAASCNFFPLPRPAPASALRLQVSSHVWFQVLGSYPASWVPHVSSPWSRVEGTLHISLLLRSQLKLDPFWEISNMIQPRCVYSPRSPHHMSFSSIDLITLVNNWPESLCRWPASTLKQEALSLICCSVLIAQDSTWNVGGNS